MRFRLLGPLEVEDQGGRIDVGGPKPRALLAALLVERGAVVSADRLVEAVWGEQPPSSATSALRAYVSRLRSALGPGARLRYRAPGYVIDVADDDLDVAQFEGLLAGARGAAAAGDHLAALGLLGTGLSLWRGDALAEFADLGFADMEAARLAELRICAAQDRAEALLQLGREAEAAIDLTALVARFPVREGAVVQLMRALYGSGRQSDALTAYHQLRHRLDDELAVEPSTAAQQLYRRILGQDPGLVVAAARTNLPRRATSFVGRSAEAAAIVAALADSPLVTLTGVGGVGKSRLAIEVAAAAQSGFADGGWLCELATLNDDGPVGDAVAVALRVQRRQGLTIEQSVIEYLRHRRLLLVLDNCEHVLPATAQLVDQVLQHCADVAVVATSREPLGVPGEQLWSVAPLSSADADALFVQRARAGRPDFAPDHNDHEAIADICRRLDGLPLGIELAAARMRAMSAAEIARRLDSVWSVGGAARTALPRHQSLTAAIDWSFRLLSEPEQQLFVRMCVLVGGGDLAGVHRVCAEPASTPDDTLDLLTRLVDKSMVTAVRGAGRSRYRLLETLRAYGRQRLQEATPGRLRDKQADYFIELAENAARGIQGAEEQAWVQQALPDYDNLRAAFEHSEAVGDADRALRLVTALPELAYLRVGYESAGWAERALDLAAPEHRLYAAAVGSAARGAWNHGDFEHARALVAKAGGRVPGRGTGRIAYPQDVLADVALYEGDARYALRHYVRESARARADADPIRLVWTLYYVAVCHAVLRAPESGLPAAQECLRVAGPTGNPTAQSMARYVLGLVQKKSDPDTALALFDQAGGLAASVGNFWWHGIALMEAAATRAVHGDPAAAARSFVAVLDHWDRVGDWPQQWLNVRYIVRLLARLGADEDAVVLHHGLVAAGRPSPLHPAQLAAMLDGPTGEQWARAARRGAELSPAGAVSTARSSLRQHG